MKYFLELVPDASAANALKLNSVLESDRAIEGEYGTTMIVDSAMFKVPGGLPVDEWPDLVEGGLSELIIFSEGKCSIRPDLTVRQKDLGPNDGIAYYYKIGNGPEQCAMGKLRTYFRGLNQKGQRGARSSAGKS